MLDYNVAVRLIYEDDDPVNCIAGYYLYNLFGNGHGSTAGRYIQKREYRVGGSWVNYQSINITGATSGFITYLSELELSPDGTKLAFADDDDLFVFSINSSGNVVGGSPAYHKFLNGSQTICIGGLEFSSDNSKLIFSTFDYTVTGGSNDDAVYIWDLATTPACSTISKFPSSGDYARSAIETGKDGKIYVAKSDGLYELFYDLSFPSCSLSIVLGLTTNVTMNSDLFQYFCSITSGFTCTQSYYGIYNLPDQIDGQLNEYLSLAQTVHRVSSGLTSWDVTFKVPSVGYNWSDASHGLTTQGSGTVYVLGKLQFQIVNSFNPPLSTPVTLNGMEMQFYTDAEMNIYQGVWVDMKATTLKGMDCGLMWKGVTLLRNLTAAFKAKIITGDDNDDWPSKIQDAYNGISLRGPHGIIEIRPWTYFSKNMVDINLSNIQSTQFKSTGGSYGRYLYSENPILPTRGAGSSNGYSDGKNRTITHILVSNYSNIEIGDLTGTTNYFYGGQQAVKAIASTIKLYNANIEGSKAFGCWFDANNQSNLFELKVQNCIFHDLVQGMLVEKKAKKTELYANSFQMTEAFGFEYRENQRGVLLIGDASDPLLNNTYTRCGISSVQCWNNSGYTKPTLQNPNPINSHIAIFNNEITDHENAMGISISEVTASKRSYGKMLLNFNTIGTTTDRIGQGIMLQQIVGANPPKALRYAKYPHNPAFKIEGNSIRFTTEISLSTIGIRAENSNSLNFLENSIMSDRMGDDYRNVGIFCGTGKNNLVWGNEVTAGIGFVAKGNGIFSNYYCNVFDHCVAGIQLLKSILRSNPTNVTINHSNYDNYFHGHMNDLTTPLLWGRPNSFFNRTSWGSDIDVNGVQNSGVYKDVIPVNQWDFLVSFYYPKVVFSPFNGKFITHTKSASDACSGEINPQIPPATNLVNINYDSVEHPVLKWQLKYSINRYYQDSFTDQWVNDSGIIAIQNIEDSIQMENYTGAMQELNNFIPTNAIDSSFKTVFSIWVNNRLELDTVWLSQNVFYIDTLWSDSVTYSIDTFYSDTISYTLNHPPLNDSLVQILTEIAELDAVLDNPAAYPARAILWSERNLLINDPQTPFYPNIAGFVLSPCLNGGNPGDTVKLFKYDGTYTGIYDITQDSGYFMLDGDTLSTLDSSTNYYISVIIAGDTLNSSAALWYQLAMASYHIFDCEYPEPITTDVKKNPSEESIRIYPNPSSTGFSLTNMPSTWKLEVSDIVGKLVWSNRGFGDSFIPVGILAKGIYSVQVSNLKTNEQNSQKILVY
jgi:hypothetical protein